ncbi:Lrp/AsnC family transcriptional regulator [Sporomusa sp.]|jgi:DNA-binding Lrp family transcriptional regulator|uniref:Lrp/AsnC family transcriptional regulator n=1 Tax=Sporomusa sp. TaxID=2078658 RepID=UPI002B89FF42|nr:Lrp/AsnC family transcriptional regulator [Sporomusa sp.]MDF2875844.1 decR [Sporomusa sp.]HWR05934.1 Lrp/AsnC family transcriptional regulator [Sporomusa sp.]
MKELLELLEKDCTQPREQLAALLHISKEEVDAHIKRLEAEKVIVKYQPIINWDQVGEDRVTAVIDVRITPQREVGFDAIAERICRFPEVVSLYLMSGAYDLSVMVEGHTLKEVSQFVATKLSTIDGVISTTTHFMLKRYKYAGVIIEDREDDHRLVVSP